MLYLLFYARPIKISTYQISDPRLINCLWGILERMVMFQWHWQSSTVPRLMQLPDGLRGVKGARGCPQLQRTSLARCLFRSALRTPSSPSGRCVWSFEFKQHFLERTGVYSYIGPPWNNQTVDFKTISLCLRPLNFPLFCGLIERNAYHPLHIECSKK
jgi:hypothetical protein